MSFFASPQKLIQSGLDLLFPPACVYCKAPNIWLCSDCYSKIPLIKSDVCYSCGTPSISVSCSQCKNNPLNYIDGIRSAAHFQDNPIRSAIHNLKYQGRKVIAETLAAILAEAYRFYKLKADVLIPVPLHRSRYKERGFNQSLLLAKELGRLVDRPVDAAMLYRIRDTGYQMEMKAHERHQNVADAFACRKPVTHQNILLIDDVCTTGATLDFCAMSLKMNGASAVWGLTLAKTH